ncbi:MAG TPA: TolC family protein, partial [Variovorax sp.]
MRTLFVPLAVLAMAAPPAFSQVAQAFAGSRYSQPAQSGATVRTQEPAGPLSLRAAVAMALRANPGLSSALREQEATEAAIVQAGAWPNPTLGAQLEDLRRDNRTTTLQLSQPIELGGKRSARVTAAERARDQATS